MKLSYLADIRFPMERANGIQTIETCHALARAGATVDLFVRRSDGRSDAECLLFYGLSPHPCLGLRRLRVPAPGSRLGTLSFAARSLAGARGGSDVLYTRDLVLADLALRLSRFHSMAIVYEAHTSAALFSAERSRLYGEAAEASRLKEARLERRERRVCRSASAVVAITRELAAVLETRHGPTAPMRVIPDGARVPAAMPAPRASGPSLRVGYVGQLYPWKGVDVLIEAMRVLPEHELVVVGGLPPEPDLDRLRGLASSLGLSERVRFRGYVPPPEVARERLECDVLAIPLLDSATARHFTSPLKLFESMASGRPIVASDLPAIREVLSHERNALLVPPGDAPALAAAIRRLTRDPALRERLASQAAREVKQYSWDERARRLLEFLREYRAGC